MPTVWDRGITVACIFPQKAVVGEDRRWEASGGHLQFSCRLCVRHAYLNDTSICCQSVTNARGSDFIQTQAADLTPLPQPWCVCTPSCDELHKRKTKPLTRKTRTTACSGGALPIASPAKGVLSYQVYDMKPIDWFLGRAHT